MSYGDDTPIYVMPVQGNVFMLVIGGVDGVNVTAQVGEDGIFLVDSGPPELGDRLVRTLREHFGEKPVRFLVNTHSHRDHVGGNLALVKTFGLENSADFSYFGIRSIAHINTVNRMSGLFDERDEVAADAVPLSSFYTEKKEVFFNGEGIVILHAPAAHTDGDAIVWFRGSDVISAGDTFVLGNYPVIDSERGGSLQGFIDAANRMVDLAIPGPASIGGTRIVPGHGRLCNEGEVADYFFLLSVIRSRVREMIQQGMTLEQVKAARPSLDYDVEAGGDKSFWTPELFIEAAYSELEGAN